MSPRILAKSLEYRPSQSRRNSGAPHRGHLSLPAFIALMLCAVTVQAFDMNSNAPITVNADSARLDDGAGKATYIGNVVVVQAATKLYADRVELYRDEEGLSRILAFGNPARYEQAETAENPATDARAEEITYDSGASVLTLREDAVIRQSGDIFRGDIIRYDTKDRIITAERGQSQGSSQVEMVIQPRGAGNEESSDGNASGQGGSDGAADSE
jgi:lipopolysaccharide export system protein LptA